MMNTAASLEAAPQQSKGIHVGLWIAQGLLAFTFLGAGFMKSTVPIAELAEKMVWPGDIPAALVRFIGTSELLGGLGLVLPAATRIKPFLTPLAAGGLLVIMGLASIFHIVRGEFQVIPFNFLLGGLAAFVAWGRLRRAPIPPRS